MKSSNFLEKLRELNNDELKTRLSDRKQELFNLRFQQATGHLDSNARIGQVKKEIARIHTILREKHIAVATREMPRSK